MRALKILVVDDFEGMRESMQEFLSGVGHVVTTASGGEEALALSAHSHEPIDVLITDIEMPRMDGIELWKRLRPRLPAARVIFLTGHPAEIFENKELLPGEVFTKPPDLERLRILLESFQDERGL